MGHDRPHGTTPGAPHPDDGPPGNRLKPRKPPSKHVLRGCVRWVFTGAHHLLAQGLGATRVIDAAQPTDFQSRWRCGLWHCKGLLAENVRAHPV
jgi:hypothetical protein